MELSTKQRPKRRRSSSTTEASMPPQRQRTIDAAIPLNPFIPSWQVVETSYDDAVLHHASMFTLPSYEEMKRSENSGPIEKFEESVMYLVQFLSFQKASSEHDAPTLLTSSEIVQLLLPWCISLIQSPKRTALNQNHFLWKAIAACTSALEPDESIISKLLSQSLLFKLVPKVARLAVSAEPDGISPTATDATSESTNSDADDVSSIVVAYRALLDLFHPTLDVACKTVLAPLLPKEEYTDRDETHHRKRDIELLRITLLWIHQIHGSRKGNPKTTFQLLSEPEVFLTFARSYAIFSALEQSTDGEIGQKTKEDGHDVVRDLLWDGLFHPRHHMEGWIALWNKELSSSTRPTIADSSSKNENMNDSTTVPFVHANPTEDYGLPYTQTQRSTLSRFKTYHGDLLDTIAKLFDFTAGSSLPKPLLVTLPALFQGFIQQSNLWNQSEKEKQGSSRRNDLLPMIQFHVFVCWARPLLQSIAISSSLPTLRQMLQIVYDSGIYSPTPEDPQFAFLEYCVSQVLRAGRVNDKSGESTMISDSIECIHLLLQLNHMLLQDDFMIDSINLCLNNSDERLREVSSQFVATVVDTYRKLRQQRHIIRFLLGVLSTQSLKGSEDEVRCLRSLLQQHPVVLALSNAMDSCPIIEAKAILESSNDWLVKSCESLHLYSAGPQVFVQLLSIVTRSIRVDNGSAADIASLCQMWISSSISTLANENFSSCGSPSPSIQITTAMSLAGVILDLHMRCVFWLQRSKLLDLPEKISTRISQIRNRKINFPAGSNDELESATFLSCHQLQQLHSLIHDDEHRFKEEERSYLGDATAGMVREARKIAKFISDQGRNLEKFQRNDGFIALAQNFSTWVAYVPVQSYLDEFLWWVVAAAAQFVRSSLKKQGFSHIECDMDDVEVASSLLLDASFFQHTEVTSRICLIGLSLAAKYFSNAESVQFQPMHSIAFSMCDYKDDDDDKTRLERIVSCGKPSFTCDSRSDFLLHMVHCTIVLVNSLQMISCNEQDCILVVDQAVRLDQSCRSVCSKPNFVSVAPIISSLRILMARLLPCASTSKVQSFLSDESRKCEFAFGAMSSAIKLLDYDENIGSKEAKQLVASTGELVDVLVGIMRLDSSTGNTLATSFSALRSLTNSTNSTHAVNALMSFSRHLVLRLKLSDLALSDSENVSVMKSLTKLFDEMKDLATEANRDFSFRHGSAFPTLPMEGLKFTDGLLLLGDLLCMDDVFVGASSEAFDGMRLSCIDCLRRSKEHRLDSPCWNIMCYLTGKVVQKCPCAELVFSVLDALFCDLPLEYETFVLEAAVCHAVPKLSRENLSAVLERIAHESVSPLSAAVRLRLLKHMLRYLTSDEQKTLLASFGRKIFTLALSSLRLERGAPFRVENISAACALLNDLLERRDVLSMKERNVALLLSYLVRALGPASIAPENDGLLLEEEESAVYSCIAEVCGALLQRYSKQVSNCAPSVISLVLALLRHAMYCPSSMDESETMLIRVQHFSRLCEVMIGLRDVFKKYVIGLVLEFMSGLEHSLISLCRKNALIPAIYFLLDTMSPFEMNQLNAQMNTKTRILFRSIHQNYLKLHSYKGQ